MADYYLLVTSFLNIAIFGVAGIIFAIYLLKRRNGRWEFAAFGTAVCWAWMLLYIFNVTRIVANPVPAELARPLVLALALLALAASIAIWKW